MFGPIYTKRQRQCRTNAVVTLDIGLIEINRVTPEWIAIPLLSDSLFSLFCIKPTSHADPWCKRVFTCTSH